MQACLNSVSNLVSRDTCARAIFDNAAQFDLSSVALIGAVAVSAILATIAARYI